MKIPKYVKLNHTELRHIPKEKIYHRDAGEWSVEYKIVNGKLLSDRSDMEWLHEIELKEISYKEWKQGNGNLKDL